MPGCSQMSRTCSALPARFSPLLAPKRGPNRAFFSNQPLKYLPKSKVPLEVRERSAGIPPPPHSSAGRHFSPHSIGHLGFSGCSLWIDLDAHVAVVLLTNRTWPDRKSQLIREVRPTFHNAVRQAL